MAAVYVKLQSSAVLNERRVLRVGSKCVVRNDCLVVRRCDVCKMVRSPIKLQLWALQRPVKCFTAAQISPVRL